MLLFEVSAVVVGYKSLQVGGDKKPEGPEGPRLPGAVKASACLDGWHDNNNHTNT